MGTKPPPGSPSGHRADTTAVDAALVALSLERTASWADIRTAFRDQIRQCHPDLAGDSEATTRRTAELNQAFGTLETATDRGRSPLPPPVCAAASPTAPAAPTPGAVVLEAPPGDVFLSLLDAAYRFGDVSYVSPEEGLLQVLVAPQNGAERYQLLITLDAAENPPQVAFALDSLSGRPGPPIADVVADFSELLSPER